MTYPVVIAARRISDAQVSITVSFDGSDRVYMFHVDPQPPTGTMQADPSMLRDFPDPEPYSGLYAVARRAYSGQPIELPVAITSRNPFESP